jgi:glutathione peroxidase
LEESYSAQGLHVLGFLSNDFNQSGDDGQIDTCNDEYGVTFQQFGTAPVTGPGAQEVFAWLNAQPNPGPSPSNEPTWNFHKYLVGKTGELVGHWVQTDYPGDDPNNPNDSLATNPIAQAIEAELAK